MENTPLTSSTHLKTPSPVTVWVKPKTRQIRRGLRLKRASGQDTQGPPVKTQPKQGQLEGHHAKMTIRAPIVVIQRQEMASFFRLFDDDLIHDFLRMDSCYKMTDKYLLAMTFVYFKRAHFSIAEYTRRHFFIALYLANTMEEDEQTKYEIFPWALGKNWRRQFPRFLKQHDKLWGRIQYRAAVSRHCCEEVMAIVPSHTVWQRERSEHHSGAQRHYGDQDHTHIPRGPSASPVSCALCNRSTTLDQGLGSSALHKGFPAQAPNPKPDPFTSFPAWETTPRKAEATYRKMVKTKSHMEHFSCCCAEEVPRDESHCGSGFDTSMDWIPEE
ncbi:hypothetical protein INR49_014296 [Caranx melampygus]|nr:hypothetical protein INR49_014296 [Caranx melampygus]